jgi:membrane protein
MIRRSIGFFKKLGIAFKDTYIAWDSRMPFASSAVIAYYTIFSLPGLLVIVINIAGYFFGKDAVTDQVAVEIQGIIGREAATYVQDIIANASQSKQSTIASIIGLVTLLFGATSVFYNVQQIFNKIWEVKVEPQAKGKFLKLLRDRLFSFGLILVVGFLLLVSLVMSTAITALSKWVSRHLSESFVVLFNAVDFLVSIGIITVLFAAMFKYLPDVKVKWKYVWVGALITTLLFVIAKYALGLYFGTSSPASTYGAAGSVILIMLWVSYSSLLLLFGAEFTRIWSKHSGHKPAPVDYAKKAPVESKTGFGSKEKKP